MLIEPHLSKPTQESGVKQTHKIPPPFTAYTQMPGHLLHTAQFHHSITLSVASIALFPGD